MNTIQMPKDIAIESAEFFSALESIYRLPMDPAMEGIFKFGANVRAQGDKMAKGLASVMQSNVGYNTLETAMNGIDSGLLDWEHRLSKETSKCVAAMFNANKDYIKLLNADLTRFRKDAAEAKKQMNDRGLPFDVRSQAKIQYDQAWDAAEKTRDRLVAARKVIEVPDAMFQAVRQCNAISTDMFQRLNTVWKAIGRTQDGFYDEEDFRYQIKEEDFIDEMGDIIQQFGNGGELRVAMDDATAKTTELMRREMIGKRLGAHPTVPMAPYSLQTSKMINSVYDEYKDITGKIHERIRNLKMILGDVRAGRDETEATFPMLHFETVAIGYFSMMLSEVMMMYLRPHFAIIEAIGPR